MLLVLNVRAINGLIKFFEYQRNVIFLQNIINYSIYCAILLCKIILNIFFIIKSTIKVINNSLTNDYNNISIDTNADYADTAVLIQLDITENTSLLQKSIKNKKILTTEKFKSISSKGCSILKLLGIGLLFIGGVSVGTYLLLHEKKYSIGYALDFVNRDVWSSMRNLYLGNTFNGSSTISNLFVLHTGDKDDCDQSVECLDILRLMERNLKSAEQLPYNFLISGDGLIYEIRGWEHVNGFESIPKQSSLVIGFMGNYTIQSPSEEQFRSLTALIAESLRRKKLDKSYQMFGIQNSNATFLDGKQLYNIISKWDHFHSVLKIP